MSMLGWWMVHTCDTVHFGGHDIAMLVSSHHLSQGCRQWTMLKALCSSGELEGTASTSRPRHWHSQWSCPC